MVSKPDADLLIPADTSQSAGSLLLAGLKTLPTSSPSVPFDAHATIYSCLLFCHLLRNTEACKRVAREVKVRDTPVDPHRSPIPPFSSPTRSADVANSAGNQAETVQEDDDEHTGLVHTVVGNLMLAQREQSQIAAHATGAAGGTAGAHFQMLGEWSRVMVGYLIVLCVWMWESPRSVREFLSEGSNLQVVSCGFWVSLKQGFDANTTYFQLIQPITQTSGVDSMVQGLSAFLLGIIYEYNREPGSVTRATLHPILQSRVGPDVFANRILRLREDVRFKNVGPDTLEMADEEDSAAEDGIWFDWAFVEFLKNNYRKFRSLCRTQ